MAAPDDLPFLVASFAPSAFVLFSVPGLDIARTWKVVGGQFLGALSGFLCVTVLGAGHLALVSVGPYAQGAKFVVFPVLVGIVLIVVFAWAVRLGAARLTARFGARSHLTDHED